MNLKKSGDQEVQLKAHLKEKVSQDVLPIHEKEREQLERLVEECVEFGTSNSVLILGLPGQGTSFVSTGIIILSR